MRRTITAFAVILAAAGCIGQAAAAQSGSRGGSFLPLGWDARGEGLAGAATLLVRGDGAAYWNPANLVFLESPGITLGTTKPVPGMQDNYSILSAGTGLLDSRRASDGSFVMRRLAAAVTMTHLGLELAEGSGWNEGTAGISAAFSINTYNSFGVSCRFLKSWTDLDDADAWGMAFDAGWTTRVHRKIWLGIVWRNLGSTIHYPESDESIDPSMNFALAAVDLFGRLSAECDAVVKESELNRILAGAELRIASDILYVMGGADIRLVNGERTIPHFGMLLRYLGIDLALSFGFDPEDDFGRTTRVSIGYSL